MKTYNVKYTIVGTVIRNILVSANNRQHAVEECCRLTGICKSGVKLVHIVHS